MREINLLQQEGGNQTNKSATHCKQNIWHCAGTLSSTLPPPLPPHIRLCRSLDRTGLILTGAKCNLGKVWVKPMMASGLLGWPRSVRSQRVLFLQGLLVLLASCVRMCRWCLRCQSCLLSSFALSAPSLSLATVSIWSGKYISTDSVSVTVPGGCRSQGHHGYLHALLKAHYSAPPSLRHLSQAHQLVTSLTVPRFHLARQRIMNTCSSIILN